MPALLKCISLAAIILLIIYKISMHKRSKKERILHYVPTPLVMCTSCITVHTVGVGTFAIITIRTVLSDKKDAVVQNREIRVRVNKATSMRSEVEWLVVIGAESIHGL